MLSLFVCACIAGLGFSFPESTQKEEISFNFSPKQVIVEEPVKVEVEKVMEFCSTGTCGRGLVGDPHGCNCSGVSKSSCNCATVSNNMSGSRMVARKVVRFRPVRKLFRRFR